MPRLDAAIANAKRIVAEHDAQETTMNDDDRRKVASDIVFLSRELIGSFFAACGGRHHYGHTCDYCLTLDLVKAAEAVQKRLKA